MSTRRQPQRLPPPLDQGEETLDGSVILDEVRGDLGLLLWKSVRAVRLWARLDTADRPTAFGEGAGERRLELLARAAPEPALECDLRVLAGVLWGDAAEPVALAGACARLAEWAERQGWLATAIELMQAAYFVDPSNAGYARAVGLLARQRAEYARAETWFRHGIATARRGRDWSDFVLSYIGLGKVHTARGNLPAARKATLRALRGASRHGRRELVGAASHSMTVIAGRMDRPSDFARYARAALEGYGPGHAWLPWLGYDVAVFWMRRGYFREALRVFLAIPDEIGLPEQRLMRAAAVVRAAGAVGDRAAYFTGWGLALPLLSESSTARGAATAMVNLARGAESLGELDRAEEYASRARETATRRAEAETAFDAEAVLESIRSVREVSQRPAAELSTAPRQVTRLARDLAVAMAPAGV